MTDLVILVVFAGTLGVDERQSLLLGLQSTVISCDHHHSELVLIEQIADFPKYLTAGCS